MFERDKILQMKWFEKAYCKNIIHKTCCQEYTQTCQNNIVLTETPLKVLILLYQPSLLSS